MVAPRRFRAISTKSTSINFSWNALNNEEANGVVRWYIITCYEADRSFVVRNACMRTHTRPCTHIRDVFRGFQKPPYKNLICRPAAVTPDYLSTEIW